jgi:hypothetical protein
MADTTRAVNTDRVSSPKDVPLGTVLMVVSLVVLSQYIIGGWINDYGHNEEIVSHVGFGGTIISIILAILAIVYSYFQTVAQRQDSYTISAQIETMRSVVEEVRRSKQGLGAELDRLDTISEKLDNALEVTRQSHEAVLHISGRFDALSAEREKIRDAADDAVSSESGLPERVYDQLVDEANDVQLALYTFLIYSAEQNTGLKDLIWEFLRGRKPVFSEQYIEGLVSGFWYVLADLNVIQMGLIGRAPAVKWIHPAFKRALEERVAIKTLEGAFPTEREWLSAQLAEPAQM